MIYNLLLILYAIGMAPHILWMKVFRKKRFPTLSDRFGKTAPTTDSHAALKVWVHAVSLGEVKASFSLITALQQKVPSLSLLITTSTATGYEEASRNASDSVQVRYLPLDFSWIMRRWISLFSPHILIFIEGDIWPNLLKVAKESHVRAALVSGKISERSAKRFRVFSSIAGRLFDPLDLMLTQNEEQRNRFQSFLKRDIEIMGNIKLSMQPVAVDPIEVRKRFRLRENQPVITIASTHAPEEKELLNWLEPLFQEMPDLVIFLAPRHPERFNEVARELKMPFSRWNQERLQESVVLVDAMGELPLCYSVSQLTIVAGSFSSKVGGHNVLEPCFYGCEVLFGPYTHAQKQLVQIALELGVGKVTRRETIILHVRESLNASAQQRSKIKRLMEIHRESATHTVDQLLKL